jgi:hypothetical protein
MTICGFIAGIVTAGSWAAAAVGVLTTAITVRPVRAGPFAVAVAARRVTGCTFTDRRRLGAVGLISLAPAALTVRTLAGRSVPLPIRPP